VIETKKKPLKTNRLYNLCYVDTAPKSRIACPIRVRHGYGADTVWIRIHGEKRRKWWINRYVARTCICVFFGTWPSPRSTSASYPRTSALATHGPPILYIFHKITSFPPFIVWDPWNRSQLLDPSQNQVLASYLLRCSCMHALRHCSLRRLRSRCCCLPAMPRAGEEAYLVDSQ
jgi:hypothetical protein